MAARRWFPAVLTLFAATALWSASAQAATITVGSPLTASFAPTTYSFQATLANLPGSGAVNMDSPVDGTIISWRALDMSGGPFKLRVLSLNHLSDAIGRGTSSGALPVAGTINASTSLPIHKGNVIGLDNTNNSDKYGSSMTGPYTSGAIYSPHVVDGGSPQPVVAGGDREFAFNATVRYCLVPNVLGTKLGAARKALAAAACTIGTIKPKKKKARKGKVVKSQSVAPGTSVSDTAAIDLKLHKQKK